jgi:hypothetical protein
MLKHSMMYRIEHPYEAIHIPHNAGTRLQGTWPFVLGEPTNRLLNMSGARIGGDIHTCLFHGPGDAATQMQAPASGSPFGV